MSRAEKFCFFIFALSSFLPYLKTSPLPTDLQPHFLLFLLLLLGSTLTDARWFSAGFVWLVLAFCYGLLAVALAAPLQICISVFTVFLVSGYFSICSHRQRSKLREILGWAAASATLVYFVFTLVDIFLGKALLESVVGNIRYSGSRGANSLTSEPSYLGVVSICLIYVLEICKVNYFRIFQFLGFVCLLASGSFYAIGPSLVILLAFYAKDFSLRNVLAVAVCSLLLVPLSQLSPERLQSILDNLLNLDFYLSDQSTVNRLARSFLPLYLSLKDFFVPHSMEYFQIDEVGALDRYLYIDFSVERMSNILSVFLYGFGFLSFPVFYLYIRRAIAVAMPLYFYVLAFYLLTANISAATPFVIFVLAAPYLFLVKSSRPHVRSSVPSSQRARSSTRVNRRPQ